MPQEKKPPQPQRPLTPEELTRFTDSKFTPSQLQLIWKRKMPVNANMEDFEMFLYICEARGLDPLLGEVFCRLQYDNGEMKLLILDSIHGMLKLADNTGEMNGLESKVEVDSGGAIISATVTVHRKGCEFPFKATAYMGEYNADTFIWRQKPRVMITKCATALALRLAFAAALAGVFVPEELDRSEAQEPDAEFVVGRLTPDVSSKVETATTVVTEDSKIIPHPEEDQHAEAMPLTITQIKAKNQALVQRLMGDLEVKQPIRITVLTDFYKGYLGVESLPRDPALFTPALEALDRFADANRDAKDQFIRGPLALGKRLREESEKHAAEAKA